MINCLMELVSISMCNSCFINPRYQAIKRTPKRPFYQSRLS
ncbi:protein of unknown function [Shewanella benthica]|uniref:Uncharacterized protein n=1 Tax=Shewanella benthica TaxID=43661 RepID=A0A330M212_9GAMM|nr:protein of unknown function [Shewanella benthica]